MPAQPLYSLLYCRLKLALSSPIHAIFIDPFLTRQSLLLSSLKAYRL